jgi:hypothetical protein
MSQPCLFIHKTSHSSVFLCLSCYTAFNWIGYKNKIVQKKLKTRLQTIALGVTERTL